jgi:hypothetical protein
VYNASTVAQEISCRPLTAEARVRSRDSLFGICGRQSGTVTRFSLSASVFRCQYHSTLTLHIRVSPGGLSVDQLAAV